jgi:starch synthase (maltosyl-transferring)
MTPDKQNMLLFVVNMDPYAMQEARLTIPLEELGIQETTQYQLHELIQDYRHDVVGREYILRLDPNHEPAAIFVIHT